MTDNIVLIGMPGSGKTTLGKILAEKLDSTFVDFDDDFIESQMGNSVGDLLQELGSEGFKQMEEKLGKSIVLDNHILGTSGSLVYAKQTMEQLKKQGTVVYLKVPLKEIKKRFSEMKTERIIGMQHMSFEDIFHQREMLYEIYSDIVFPYSGSNIEEVSHDLIEQLGKNSESMTS